MTLKISTFPKAKAHPANKDEKAYYSKFSSYPNEAVTTEAKDLDTLIDTICENAWSPFVFNRYRREDCFISVDFITFDIDEGMTIDEAYDTVEKLKVCGICLPSPSHTEEQHKYRLIFPLARTITTISEFKATYAKLAEHFPVDPQCKDACRFYYGSTDNDGFFLKGKLVEPVAPQKPQNRFLDTFSTGDDVEVGETIEELVEALYGEKREKIPEQVAFFLENAETSLPGLWHSSFNSFIFTLSLQNVPFDVIVKVAEQVAPEPLDKHDKALLKRAYRDGQIKREDL